MSGREHGPGEADLAWCHEAVQGVSRTFALTVDVLEEPMASQICVGYLLCRVADTVEDAGHIPPDAQSDVLRTYRRAIDPDDATDIGAFRGAVDEWLPAERDEDWTVVAEAPTIAATFEELDPEAQEAIVPPVLEMVDGMAMFVDRHATEGGLRISDRDELEQYCYYAAGTVGNLITNLLTREDIGEERAERLRETAEEFGLLLQLVNVSKDVYDDYTEENNVYLPAVWLESEGVPQEEVVDPRHERGASSVVRRTAEHAKSFVDDAQTYLELVPTHDGNTLAAWAIPYLLAVGTLRELLSRPEDALREGDVKVSRQEVFAVVSAMSDTDDRSMLGELRGIISRKPYHRVATSAD